MTKRKSKSAKITVKAATAKTAVTRSSALAPTSTTPPLIVLAHQTGPDQERFTDLGYRPRRQTQRTGDDVQSRRTLGHDPQIRLFGWTQAPVVQLLQQTGPL